MIELFVSLVVLVMSLIVGLFGMVVPFLGFLLIVYLIVVAAKRQLDLHARLLRELAESWGMQSDGSRIYGELDGIHASVRRLMTDNSVYRRFEWRIPPPWTGLLSVRKTNPLDQLQTALGVEDIAVGDPSLDKGLWIKGCERTARSVLGDPEVAELLKALAALGRLEFSPKMLGLQEPGQLNDECEERLHMGAQLISAMERARRDPWEATATALGLDLDADALSIDGFVADRRVTIHQDARPRVRTVIRIPLRTALPAGTHLARKGEGESVVLRDPILDGNLHIQGDAEALAPLLCDDDTRGLVMTLLHGHPGSTLTEEVLEVVAKGRLMAELEQTTRDALELVSRLERAIAGTSALEVAHPETQST
jgi:hypothetical protein